MKLFFPLVILVFFLSACSGSDSTSDLPVNDASSFDGAYDLTAVNTTSFDNDGGECGRGSGTLTIIGSRVSGSVFAAASGQEYELSGSVDSSGNLEAGVAISQQEVITYEGRIIGDSGTGTWMDFFGCRGTWEMQRTAQ